MKPHLPSAQFSRNLKPALSLGVYCAALLLLVGAILSGFSELADKQASVERLHEQLAQLVRAQARVNAQESTEMVPPPGDTFFSGDRPSIAAAELQRRVGANIAAAGGTVLSSQMERPETGDNASGLLSLSVDWEISQAKLGRALYDLEAQPPFVFIETINLRSRTDPIDDKAPARLRISSRFSAYWKDPAR